MAGTEYGPVGVVDMSAYSPTQEYKYLNEVTEDGSTYRYIALAPSTGKPLPVHPATSTPYWRLTARAGRDGVDGQLLYPLIEVDWETGQFVLVIPDRYEGPTFEIDSATGMWEVVIDG